jgi:diaminopimelate epimerase
MDLLFRKYEAAGNDFVMIDNRLSLFVPTEKNVKYLCDRRMGVGADGLILLEKHHDCDFLMRYFNSDGKESTFCGNGGRAVTAFAFALGMGQDHFVFKAMDGLHESDIVKNTGRQQIIALSMQDVLVDNALTINTGSPHHVVSVEGLQKMDVQKEGSRLRNDPRFAPEGCNVNFVEAKTEGLFLRTYERGVEEETLSCGTGATATAISLALDKPDGDYLTEIHARGGLLTITFTKEKNKFTRVKLIGPANEVFSGMIFI